MDPMELKSTELVDEALRRYPLHDKAQPFESRAFFELCQHYRVMPPHKITEVCQAFEAVKEFGKRALSQTAGRWIPVSERLPDDEQTVLAAWVGPSCSPSGCGETLTYHAADAPDGPEAWSSAWGEDVDPPTHWMPWEPPKEEANG